MAGPLQKAFPAAILGVLGAWELGPITLAPFPLCLDQVNTNVSRDFSAGLVRGIALPKSPPELTKLLLKAVPVDLFLCQME